MTFDTFPFSKTPALVGFDRLFDDLTKFANITKEASYPPHNIVKINDTDYTIELAVAGFSEKDISVELKDNILYVKGEKENKENLVFVHKGISAKKFTKSFKLHSDAEVTGAVLVNGILEISLHIAQKEQDAVKQIPVLTTKTSGVLLEQKS